MIKRRMKQFAVVCLAASLAVHPITVSAALLKRGTKNQEVQTVQTTLKQLGYFNYHKTTGYYGRITESAVIRFQRAKGLVPDGIVGRNTLKALSNYTPKVASATMVKKNTNNGALDWFKEVRYIWTKGSNATITDVDTGKSFQVKRTFGYNHADVEPLTKEDSKTIKQIWNGWSWERRAVVVQVGDNVIAASMTAMPHAGLDSAPSEKLVSNRSGNYGWGYNLDAVKNNGASGVMDIHFLNSRTHSTNVKQKSQQDMVNKASIFIENNSTIINQTSR